MHCLQTALSRQPPIDRYYINKLCLGDTVVPQMAIYGQLLKKRKVYSAQSKE